MNKSILTYGGHGKNGYSFFETETLFVEKHQGNVRSFEQIKKDNGILSCGVVYIATIINQETGKQEAWTNPRFKEMARKFKLYDKKKEKYL